MCIYIRINNKFLFFKLFHENNLMVIQINYHQIISDLFFSNQKINLTRLIFRRLNKKQKIEKFDLQHQGGQLNQIKVMKTNITIFYSYKNVRHEKLFLNIKKIYIMGFERKIKQYLIF